MRVPYRLVTGPLHLTGRLRLAHLVLLTSTDALLRRARAKGDRVAWAPCSLSGDLAVQLAVEREVAREGHDRTTLGRTAFVERVRDYERRAREQLRATLEALGVEADVDEGASDSDAMVLAARTAFVRLYEEGRLEQSEEVVDLCPRCETVVDPAEATTLEVPHRLLVLRLDAGGTAVDVTVRAPELLPGAVALAVPEGHDAAGAEVEVPLAGRKVAVVTDPDATAPWMLVPAHDAGALAVSRRLGLLPVEVFGPDGTVGGDGPLAGLARHAARVAAEDHLAGTDLVVAGEDEIEEVRACRRCGTMLLPRLGRHWFLSVGDLESDAADVVREGAMTFHPPTARDELLDAAGRGGRWCLSHQLWAGQPVPVSTCTDCGRPTVEVDPSPMCGKCMGNLVPDDEVLDARFVGALWPLAFAGWPADDDAPNRLAEGTTLLVASGGIDRWALPMAALGLRLTGAVPFSALTVVSVVDGEEPLADHAALDRLLETEGQRAVRLALVAGGLDVESAHALLAGLDEPPDGEPDLDAVEETYDAAFAACVPADAVPLLGTAIAEGVTPGGAERLRALMAPITGD